MGQQNSYMTLIGVYSTMHLMHLQLMLCNYNYVQISVSYRPEGGGDMFPPPPERYG